MRREETDRGRIVLGWTFVYFGTAVLVILILAFLMVRGDEVAENPTPTPAPTAMEISTQGGDLNNHPASLDRESGFSHMEV